MIDESREVLAPSEHAESVAAPTCRCALPECGRLFAPRRGGKPQRFCSALCRKTAWLEARRRAAVEIRGAVPAQTNVQSNAHVATARPEQKSGPVVANGCCRWCGAELPALGHASHFCGRACQDRFWTALRWAAFEDHLAGRLPLERLKEVDQRRREEAAAARERARQQSAQRERRRRWRRRRTKHRAQIEAGRARAEQAP